jgi:hypothetical protein
VLRLAVPEVTKRRQGNKRSEGSLPETYYYVTAEPQSCRGEGIRSSRTDERQRTTSTRLLRSVPFRSVRRPHPLSL